ncbi:hypothetical protein SAY87_029725 [Trapa incisa]|uniref:Uncharacterized protein n=1 Tax=Trapa incisa TaxID=236973 RepID=A0AAN7KD80_9MYRT|nr:hypothetical protein SAY87_029725 [Trapa incisa]
MDPYHIESPFVSDISSDEEYCGLLEGEPSFEDNEDSDCLAKFVREETNACSLGRDSDEIVLVKEMNNSSNIGLSPPLNLDGIYKPTPRYPASEAICGRSNDLPNSFQHTLPSQAQADNDAQFQICEAVFVNQHNFQSSAKHSLTAAEIESWFRGRDPSVY